MSASSPPRLAAVATAISASSPPAARLASRPAEGSPVAGSTCGLAPSAAACAAFFSFFLFFFNSSFSFLQLSNSSLASLSLLATFEIVFSNLSFSDERSLQNLEASTHCCSNVTFSRCSACSAARNSAIRSSLICSPSSLFSSSNARHFLIMACPASECWSNRFASNSSRSSLICRSFSRAFCLSMLTSMFAVGSTRAPRTAAREMSP
mmetsp:Transcript_18295/g.33629  ORF Transcript_18295/g.33629 Transcript_18295/m.33629 type:complete len:208 (+) Transcript_18295:271-894(+)